ncbi:type I-B CRISPR-associated protein Cas8b1/Cst1 [Persephonella sp.]
MERVYLGDWLFNAGILGFLKINRNFWDIQSGKLISKDEDILRFGDNYIEFDRKIFEGFSKRFFDYAFNQYGRYENLLKLFEEYIEDLQKLDSEENYKKFKNKYFRNKDIKVENIPIFLSIEIFDRFKKILQGFSLLKKKLNKIPSKNEVKKDSGLLIDSIKKAMDIMENEKGEFWESDVQIYLRRIYGQKSFLNKSMNKDRFKKFYRDFEEPLISNSIKHDKIYKCINCMERQAKKDTIFDTGISKFYGLNPDSINFVWNFKTKLPLCEICEIIYFSYFAGLTPVNKNGKIVFYYVNSDTSVENLLKENLLLENKLTKDISENFIVDFFTELILMAEEEKARYTLQNTVLIELDLNNETMPKIYSFNISREKAEFLRDSKDNLKNISRTFYKIKSDSFSVLTELIEKVLNNSLNYKFLNKITKIYIQNSNNSQYYQTNINTYQLQVINLLIKDFLQKVILGGNEMEITKEDLWKVYFRGQDLAKKLKKSNAENKIQSISYKLLNALRIGDTNQFMDVLIRTYMAYGEEIPSTFVKAISDKNVFYPLGYSFLNGLLGKENKEEVLNNG